MRLLHQVKEAFNMNTHKILADLPTNFPYLPPEPPVLYWELSVSQKVHLLPLPPGSPRNVTLLLVIMDNIIAKQLS